MFVLKEKWKYELFNKVYGLLPDFIRKNYMLDRIAEFLIMDLIDSMHTYVPLRKMNVIHAFIIGVLVSKDLVDVVILNGEVYVRLKKI